MTLSPPPLSHSALSITSLDSSVWHKRLGHLNCYILTRILSYFSSSIPKTNLTTLCQACQLGKQTQLPFFDSNTVDTSPFEIVNSDIWTSPISSISEMKYYLIFLDHYSHFLWVYPLHRKSEILSKYMHFYNYVKTHFNRLIKSLEYENGGEYDNCLFKEHLASTDILFRFSCPHTSQQNGQAECMLPIINNMIRTLIFQASTPPEYWVEALHTTAHLLNIIPSTAINNEAPIVAYSRHHQTTNISTRLAAYVIRISYLPQSISWRHVQHHVSSLGILKIIVAIGALTSTPNHTLSLRRVR